MSGSLTPNGDKYCFEQLNYINSVDNIKLSAKITSYSATGKIYSIENGIITIDGIQQGRFNTSNDMAGVENNKSAVNISGVQLYQIKLVGDNIADFIVKCEEYFKPVNSLTGE